MSGKALRLLFLLGAPFIAVAHIDGQARYPQCYTQTPFSNTTLNTVVTAKVLPGLKWKSDESPSVVARGLLESLNSNNRGIKFVVANGVTPNLYLNLSLGGSMEGTNQLIAYVEVTGLGKSGVLFTENSGTAPFANWDDAFDRLAENMMSWFANGWSTRPPCYRNGHLVRSNGQSSSSEAPAINAGIYGGGLWATESFDATNFKRGVEPGWTGGAMVQVGHKVGLRADGSYFAFGKSKDPESLNATTKVIAATGAIVVDLGGLYFLGGGGWYQFDFKEDGAAESITKSHWGANAGIGLDLPMHLFAEGRGHVVFPENGVVGGNASFVTAALGIRFR